MRIALKYNTITIKKFVFISTYLKLKLIWQILEFVKHEEDR